MIRTLPFRHHRRRDIIRTAPTGGATAQRTDSVAGETRYELLETVGTGRYTTVYRARDRELNREVAVKQLRDEYHGGTLQMDRYWQEAQLLASLQHPNIVTIYDINRQ